MCKHNVKNLCAANVIEMPHLSWIGVFVQYKAIEMGFKYKCCFADTESDYHKINKKELNRSPNRTEPSTIIYFLCNCMRFRIFVCVCVRLLTLHLTLSELDNIAFVYVLLSVALFICTHCTVHMDRRWLKGAKANILWKWPENGSFSYH